MNFLAIINNTAIAVFILFLPHFNFFFRVKSADLLASFFVLYLLISKRIIVGKDFFTFLIIVFSIFVFISIINLHFSFEFLRQIFLFLILYIFIKFWMEEFLKKYSLSSFIDILFYAVFLNSFVIIFSALSDEFSKSFYSFVMLTDKAHRYIGDNVLVSRFSGFAPSGFSIFSVYYALLLILINEMKLFFRSNVSFVYLFFILLSCIALVLIGRSGLLLFILYFLLRLFSFNFKFIIFFFFAAASFLFLISSIVFSDEFILYFEFAFEIFLNNFSTESTDTLLSNEYFIPDVGIFGNGRLTRDEFGQNSDVGFIKFLGYMGPIILIAYLFSFVTFFSNSFKAFKDFKMLSFFYFSSYLIFNFKDFYFLSSGYIQAFLIYYFISSYSVKTSFYRR